MVVTLEAVCGGELKAVPVKTALVSVYDKTGLEAMASNNGEGAVGGVAGAVAGLARLSANERGGIGTGTAGGVGMGAEGGIGTGMEAEQRRMEGFVG